MKTKNFIKVFILSLFVVGFTSCKDQNEPTPPIQIIQLDSATVLKNAMSDNLKHDWKLVGESVVDSAKLSDVTTKSTEWRISSITLNFIVNDMTYTEIRDRIKETYQIGYLKDSELDGYIKNYDWVMGHINGTGYYLQYRLFTKLIVLK